MNESRFVCGRLAHHCRLEQTWRARLENRPRPFHTRLIRASDVVVLILLVFIYTQCRRQMRRGIFGVARVLAQCGRYVFVVPCGLSSECAQ